MLMANSKSLIANRKWLWALGVELWAAASCILLLAPGLKPKPIRIIRPPASACVMEW